MLFGFDNLSGSHYTRNQHKCKGIATMGISRQQGEQFLHMATELKKRRELDPLRHFTPHEKQQRFIDSVLHQERPENWFIAANRSGKSDAGAYCGASLARFGLDEPAVARSGDGAVEVRDRATSGWVSALDFPTSRDVLQPKYFDNGFVVRGQGSEPFIPDHEVEEWRVSDQILKLKNGSLIGFKSADSGAKKYQGAGKTWFHMDEEHPYDIYEESVIRVGRGTFLFFCTCTLLPPEGQRSSVISWVFPKIINPWKQGELPHVALFGASIYDNPAIAESEIRRLEAIYPVGSPARRIRLLGEWLPGIGGARAYASFDRSLHVRTQPDIAQRRPLFWIWDFNVEPLVSLIAQRDNNVYRIFNELVLDEGSVGEMCQLFYDRFPTHQAEIWIYGDASGSKRTSQTGKTDYFLIQNEMKAYGVPLRMKVPEENPHVPDRVNSVNRLLYDEEGVVRTQIDPSCGELIADLEGVLRDNRGGLLKSYNRKDPYSRRTHTSDAWGYFTSYEEPVRPPQSATYRNINLGLPRYFRRNG